jgi:hypothetical protein
MGLDMYLSARKYINKVDWSIVEKQDTVDYSAATIPQWNNIVEAAELSDVANKKDIYGVSVSVNCAYWRKANQIHKWFVTNVQNDEDDCGEYYVSHDRLKELLTTARQALFHKDPSLLPPQGGFFFGNTDIDQWYWEDVKNTIKQLDRLVNLDEFDELSFYYQSSW